MSFLLDLTPLRTSPSYRRLWLGLGISNLGTQFTVTAVGLQVYAITGSTFSVGVLGVCALVPLVVLGLYGGALVDVYDRRKVALIASVGLWVVSGAARRSRPGCTSTPSPLLYALVALQSAGFAVNNPARSAIIPRLVEPDLLPAANVLQTVSWNIAFIVGPLLGAFLVAGGDFGLAYTVDVVLFSAALWALWRLPDLPPVEAVEGAPRRKRGLASVLEGLRYLATRPNVRMTFVVDLTAMILAMPRVLLPGGRRAVAGRRRRDHGRAQRRVRGRRGAGRAALRRPGPRTAPGTRHRRRRSWSFGLAVAAFGLVLLGVGRTSPSDVVVPAAGAVVHLPGPRRRRRRGQLGVPPDDPAGGDAGRHARPAAGRVHRGGRRRAPARRPGAGHRGRPGRRGVGRARRRPRSASSVLVVVVALQRRFWAYDARDPQP